MNANNAVLIGICFVILVMIILTIMISSGDDNDDESTNKVITKKVKTNTEFFTRLCTDVSVENPGTATQTISATPLLPPPLPSTACVDGSTWSATGSDPCTPCSACQSPQITNQQCTATSNTTCTRPPPQKPKEEATTPVQPLQIPPIAQPLPPQGHPMLGMGSPVTYGGAVCTGDAFLWEMCGSKRDELGNTIQPSWSFDQSTEQDWGWTHTNDYVDPPVEITGTCRWQPIVDTFGQCVGPLSVTKMIDGQKWGWIPKTDGCMEFCHPDGGHPPDCNPLSMDDSVPPQYIHNINNPSDSWGACTNHPAFNGALQTKCDQRCSVPDRIDDCRQCITDNIGSFWDPFDQCSLLEIGEETGDLKNVCNAPENTYVGRKAWNYQLVPETSDYQCTDACTN